MDKLHRFHLIRKQEKIMLVQMNLGQRRIGNINLRNFVVVLQIKSVLELHVDIIIFYLFIGEDKCKIFC